MCGHALLKAGGRSALGQAHTCDASKSQPGTGPFAHVPSAKANPMAQVSTRRVGSSRMTRSKDREGRRS